MWEAEDEGNGKGGKGEGGNLAGLTGLEHVPVRDAVEVLGEERVVCIDEEVEGVRARDFGEEVVTVAEEDLGCLVL